jgi:hypothetical protein
MQGVALQVRAVGSLAARGARTHVGRIQVERDGVPDADQRQAKSSTWRSALFQLADVAEAEPPQEPPRGLGRGDAEASHRFLCPVPSGNLQVVEALAPRARASVIPRIDSASDNPRSRTSRCSSALIAGPSPIASAVAHSRTARAWAVISRSVVESSTLGAPPDILTFASASCAREIGWLGNPISLLRRLFLWISALAVSAYRWF